MKFSAQFASPMQSQKFIIAIIAVLTLNPIQPAVQATCSLTAPMVQLEPRTYFATENGGFKLMFTESVPWRTTVHLVCNAQDIVNINCGIWGNFDRNPPVGNCPRPIKPRVELVADRSCPYSMYTVSYATALAPGSRTVEDYYSCYNVPLMSAQFVVHRAYAYSITTPRPSASFTTDGVITMADADSFKAENVYARFKLLLGVNQNYVTNGRDIVIHRGHLAPSADFLFKQAMVATFKYINVVPQFASINQGNWAAIETWVRTHVQSTGRAFIVTGTIAVLRLCSTRGYLVPIYLAPGNRNPIPKWIYKVVDSSAVRTVFVTLNNRYAWIAPRPICLTEACPSGIQLIATGRRGYTYCCNVDDFQRTYLPNLDLPYYDDDDKDEL